MWQERITQMVKNKGKSFNGYQKNSIIGPFKQEKWQDKKRSPNYYISLQHSGQFAFGPDQHLRHGLSQGRRFENYVVVFVLSGGAQFREKYNNHL